MVVCLNWVNINDTVLREGKNKVFQDEYDAEKYPAFCNGPGIAYSREGTDKNWLALLVENGVFTRYKAAEKILIESAATEPFRLEDVYFSGILRRRQIFQYIMKRKDTKFFSKTMI